MKKITFLGPVGATFSHDAYDRLAEIYNAPIVESFGSISNCIPASTNEDVLQKIVEHGGYGAIAMETLVGGRVAEPLESFISLLTQYDHEICPLHIVGAIRMTLHFCLMERKDLRLLAPEKILAHPKAIGACKERAANCGAEIVEVSSNGEAARLVAQDDRFATSIAIGPRSAAHTYDLRIIDPMFEDAKAMTTFFLIAPRSHAIVTGKKNRALILFVIRDKPGSLVNVLQPFDNEGLNMIQIHSVYAGDNQYDFAIEFDLVEAQFSSFRRAMNIFASIVQKYIRLGPFEITSE